MSKKATLLFVEECYVFDIISLKNSEKTGTVTML